MRRLADIAGVSATVGRSYDWAAIEADLGVRLPSDYKLIAELFPEGWFRMFAEAWLPASEQRLLNARSLNVMDAVREVQEDEDFSYIDFPFPVFPNPGGLLPCGWLRVPGHIFWVTGPGDPDEWPLVLAEEEYEYWERFEGPLCEFLTEVALGRFDASGFKDDYGWGGQRHIDIASRPVFGNDVSAPAGWVSPPMPPVPDPEFWESRIRKLGRPEPMSEIAGLRVVLGPPPAGVGAVDWEAVHARLGFVLPSDYREFIDSYGPGTVGDIQIMAPGAPGEMDLFALLEQRYDQVQGAERDSRSDVPCFPEEGGVVSWGVTGSGETCAWAPMSPDPDGWPSALIYAKASMPMRWLDGGMSFSRMLRCYAERDPESLLTADPGIGEVRFTPYRPDPR